MKDSKEVITVAERLTAQMQFFVSASSKTMIVDVHTYERHSHLALFIAAHLAVVHPDASVAVGGQLPLLKPAAKIAAEKGALKPTFWAPLTTLSSPPAFNLEEGVAVLNQNSSANPSGFDVFVRASLESEQPADINFSFCDSVLGNFNASPGSKLGLLLKDYDHTKSFSSPLNEAVLELIDLLPQFPATGALPAFTRVENVSPVEGSGLLAQQIMMLPGWYETHRNSASRSQWIKEQRSLEQFLNFYAPSEGLQAVISGLVRNDGHSGNLLSLFTTAKALA